MSLIKATKNAVSPGGKHGLSNRESRDPIGYAVLALNKLAQSELIDRMGLRKQTEQTVFTVTRSGFKVAGQAGRAFAKKGKKGADGVRVPTANPTGVFDLTPTEDEQMLVDVVSEFAAEALRPAAAEANETCLAPDDLLKSSLEIGLPILGVPEKLGGISEERSAMAGTWSPRLSPRATWVWLWPRSPARSPPHSPCGAPTSSSRPTSPSSPATTFPPRLWPSTSRRCSSTCSSPGRWPPRPTAATCSTV